MDREPCLTFIEQTYFGNVQTGNIDAVIECFTEQAKVVIRHGDNPQKLFSMRPSENETPLPDFYQHLCSNYAAWFGDFQHFVDSEAARAASHFTVRLSPYPDGLYADAGPQELLNGNFFEFDNGLISHMIIYYANPQTTHVSGLQHESPTGYPK